MGHTWTTQGREMAIGEHPPIIFVELLPLTGNRLVPPGCSIRTPIEPSSRYRKKKDKRQGGVHRPIALQCLIVLLFEEKWRWQADWPRGFCGVAPHSHIEQFPLAALLRHQLTEFRRLANHFLGSRRASSASQAKFGT